MRILLLAALTLLAACQSIAPAAPPPADAPLPNIVIILADDMGYSDIGCCGSEIATPHLDRLAANGLKFRHFYNAARCCPTRAALLTGQYPHAAGMEGMVSPAGSNPRTGPRGGASTATLASSVGRAATIPYAPTRNGCGRWPSIAYPGRYPTAASTPRTPTPTLP